jgi:site-specific DNA-methyltransferase (adenine-specific)
MSRGNLPEPYYQDDSGVIYHGDCLEIMRGIPDSSIDLVCTDPPYGMMYKSNMRSVSHDYIAGDAGFEWLAPFLVQSFRVLADGGAIYSCCNDYGASDFRKEYQSVGFTPKRLIVLRKNNHTSGDLEGDYGNITEFIAWATKGRHLLNGKRITNCWDIVRENTDVHLTRKPIASAAIPIEKSSSAGHIVLDPFGGSGTTGRVAEQLRRRWVLIELNPDYLQLIRRRTSVKGLL